MSVFTYEKLSHGSPPWQKTLTTDFSGEAVGGSILYTDFTTDGNLFVIRDQGGVITSFTEMTPSGETLFSATTNIAMSDFLPLIQGGHRAKEIVRLLSGQDDDILGSSKGDKLYGGDGADTIDGGAGRDHLTGGAGSDHFVFTGAFGADVVSDFDAASPAHDFLQFDLSLFATADDVLAHAQDVAGGVLISADATHSVLLSGVHLADLSTADILLV